MSAHTPVLLAVSDTGCLYNKAAAHQHAEPLKINSPWIEDAFDGDAEAEANMRRLAACWNICDGLTTGTLENIVLTGDTMVSRSIAAQRDHAELLAALEKATAHIHPDSPDFAECERLIVKHGGGK